MKNLLSTLIFALTTLVACGVDEGAPPLDAPVSRPMGIFVDDCGNELYSDDIGARRLYVSVVPHIYAPPIPLWDDLPIDDQKAWGAAMEELLSFPSCPGPK